MKTLYIASTPFHIFNILNICDSESTIKSECDLLLIDFGTDILKSIEIDELKKQFANVYTHHIKVQKGKFAKRISLIYQIYKKRPFGLKIDNKYDTIYIFGTESYTKAIAFILGAFSFELN